MAGVFNLSILMTDLANHVSRHDHSASVFMSARAGDFFPPPATFSLPPATFLAGAPRRPARARPQDHPSIPPIIHLALQAYSWGSQKRLLGGMKSNNRIIRMMRMPGTHNVTVAAVWSTLWRQPLIFPRKNTHSASSGELIKYP